MPTVDALGNGRAGEQGGQGEGEVGGHGDQGGAQRVARDGLALDQPLGPGGAHVIGPQGVEHEVALVARVAGDAAQRHGQGRQEQVLEPAHHPGALAGEFEDLVAGGPVELDGEDLEEDRYDHRRGRDQDHGQQRDHAVRELVLAGGGPRAQRDASDHSHRGANDDQAQRDADLGPEDPVDRLP